MRENLRLAIALLRENQAKPLLLIAIDGQSAAGKSTLARALQRHLPQVSLVQTDDFYRPLPEEARWAFDAVGGYLHYYDWQRLEAQVLAPLRAGQASHYQKYDWAENRLAAWASVQPAGIVLVEGCYAARPELKRYYDLILLVEAPATVRTARQTARADATQAWLERWDAAERYYLEQHQPQRYADLILPGAAQEQT